MLQSFITSKTINILLNRHTIRIIQQVNFSYEKRTRQYHNDEIDLTQQTVEIDSKEHIRRCSFYKDTDIWSFYKTLCPNVRTLGDALTEGLVVSKDGPCLGAFPSSDETKSLEWLSYSDVIERCQTIGSYLMTKLKLIPKKSKVLVLSSNRAEAFIVEHACYMYGFIFVSLYTSYDSATIQSVLRRTQGDVLIVDNLTRIKSFKENLLTNDQIKEILVFDDSNKQDHEKVHSFSTVFTSMKTADLCPRPTIDPDDVATFVLTSGTTGEPKIAMLSHENIIATAKGYRIRLDRANVGKPITDRHCSFLPMQHIYERFVLINCLLQGTQLVFCPTPEKLLHYLAVVKPTQASVVPRVLNKVYDAAMNEISKSKLKQLIVQRALRKQTPVISYLAFRKIRKLFGNELMGMITGAAPTLPDVMHFFRVALHITIMEGYGQTETAGAGASTHLTDFSFGTMGSPVPTLEMKLVDVLGTDYRSANNQGEVCMRGPNVFKGYYDDEAKTRETLDKDGWLHTGDVGEWTSNGTLRIIDRSKHIFKLSQGKYIAPERLEDIYIRSRWVAQIFVDAISTESSVVAIVIPDENYVRKNFQATTNQAAFADLCLSSDLKKVILADLNNLAETHKLKMHEKLINIHLHPELFSPENGLLTVTFKTKRTNARKHFQSTMTSLYDSNTTKMIRG